MANATKEAGQIAAAEPWTDRPMSVEEWAALPDDVPGEIANGMLVEEEDVGILHEAIVTKLASILDQWAEPRGGIVATSDAKFALSAKDGRKPDITVFLRGSPKPSPRGIVRVPPHIAIEVVSATPRDARRDRVEKPKEYAAFGVPWYWIVDPQVRTLEIRELGADGRYVDALAVAGGVIESVPGCDGLTLDVDAVWRKLDWFAGEGIETPEE